METQSETHIIIPTNKFKSYYVVWKHCGFVSVNKAINGLNRTMQYGNRKKTMRQYQLQKV